MKPLLTFIAFISAFISAVAQNDTSAINIEIATDGNMMNITGVYKNNTSKNHANLTYKLKVERQGKAGITSSNQGGQFSAQKGERIILSTSSINVSEKDTYNITLQILDKKGNLLDEKTITRP